MQYLDKRCGLVYNSRYVVWKDEMLMNEENKMKIKDILEWVYCIVIAVVLCINC